MNRIRSFVVVLLCTLHAGLVLQAQTTILDESLRDGALPAGWSITDVTFATAAGGYANVSGTTGVVQTPILDLSGYTSADLFFAVAKFGSGDNGPITVEVSDDGGATFTAQTFDSGVPTGSIYINEGPISLNVLTANVVIRFTAANSPSAKRLRDIVIEGELLPGTVTGCTDPLACNYDEDAEVEDGSCLFVGASCDDGDNATINDEINLDCSCEGTPVVLPELVINEIHYDPCQAQGPDNEFEFIEIYNNGLDLVDLEGFTLSGSINFTFPEGTTIGADEYVVVAVASSSYEGNGYQVFEWGTGALGNNGGTVTLSTSEGAVVSTVTYNNSAPWPTAPNGNCPSLELIDPSLDNGVAVNWQASYVANGTPGAVNSTPAAAIGYTISEIQSDADTNGASALTGVVVATQGVVTGVYADAGVFSMQDGPGAWSGIWVATSLPVVVGDEVTVIGTVTEQFGLTIITGVSDLEVVSQGNPLPAAQSLFTADINNEEWEGVLLEITGIVTTGDANFGEWIIDDGSGPARIDNLGIEVTPVDLDVQFTVIGPNYFSFGNFKLEPRDSSDILRWGCTDDSFANYDPEAVINDGSCSSLEGCTDPLADNYNPDAVVDDGTCFINGCTDDAALNFNPNATADDGSCYFTAPNIVINEIHYNPCEFQGSDFDYEFVELYNADVTEVNLAGFVISGSIQFTFPQGASMMPGEYIVVAINAEFYTGNGYQVFEWTSGNLGNGTGNVTLSDAFENPIASVGYLSSAPWPFLAGGQCPSLELIDPSLDPSDPANWQSSFVIFGTPGAANSQNVTGCMNQAACNYNPLAIADDGSCEFVSCAGCTYEVASNYNPAATNDDGSCDFEPVNDCIGDLNSDGVVNAADLGSFLTVFGTSCQ